MRQYRFYHRETGIIHPGTFATDDARSDAVQANTPADHIAIEAELDHLSQRVDVTTGKVVDYQPPQPSSDHEWNAQIKRWQLKADVAEREQRRAAALRQIAALEASQARPLREAALGMPGAADRLKALDAQIAALRAAL